MQGQGDSCHWQCCDRDPVHWYGELRRGGTGIRLLGRTGSGRSCRWALWGSGWRCYGFFCYGRDRSLGIVSFGGLAAGVYAMGGCAAAVRVAAGGIASAPVAIGHTASGELTLRLPAAGAASQIRATILQKYPDTWELLLWLFSWVAYEAIP